MNKTGPKTDPWGAAWSNFGRKLKLKLLFCPLLNGQIYSSATVLGHFEKFMRTDPTYSFLYKDILHFSTNDKRAYWELVPLLYLHKKDHKSTQYDSTGLYFSNNLGIFFLWTRLTSAKFKFCEKLCFCSIWKFHAIFLNPKLKNVRRLF